MSIYKYTCKHLNCEQLKPKIRMCKDCDRIIMTDFDIYDEE